VPLQVRASIVSALLLLAICPVVLTAQRPANSNSYYQNLRNLLPGGEVIMVNNFELHRDAATFIFTRGDFAFYGEVKGKVTGAVFKGQGHLHIKPPVGAERHNLSVLNHSEEWDEDFDQVVLRFTDDTASELHKAAAGKGESDTAFGRAGQDLQSFARRHLNQNLDLRVLEDVLSPAQGGYFLAGIHGKKNSHLFFLIDPHGVNELAPEEVALLNWDEQTVTYPLAFHRTEEYAAGTPSGNEHNGAYRVTSENLDVTIEKSGFLTSLATVEITAEQDGVAVIPLDLYPTLRVSKVESGKGESLDYVQEKKEDDPDFGVVLAQPLKMGESTTLKITYGGKDVVLSEGGGNYYPVARENWYPNSGQGFGDYATYRMLFHIPKGLQVIGTGTRVSETTEGKWITSEWKTEVPLPVVGFSLGDFETKEAKLGSALDQLTVDAYANKGKPDFVNRLLQPVPQELGPNTSGEGSSALGQLSTTPMLASELGQGEMAAQVYSNFFGALPFSHISLTQQTACGYGQSWPMLVYLPICGFFDDTQRHFLGLGGENLNRHMYWKVVTPHEVAHQWWGQTVGFRSYRDQWMSEGFADASAALYLQATRPKPDEFREFWKQEREMITQKNQFGFRPIDVGPVTMGFRLSSPKTGWSVYDELVYPKGAYILHMIRMMMFTTKDGDQTFRETMHDFVSKYRLQPATTEDFKAVVEKHMTPAMDLDGNHRMDWFFNEYVYGTDLPAYHFESQITGSGDAQSLHFKLVQSGVNDKFRMAVPVYFELGDGKIIRAGTATISGSSTVEKSLPLPKFSSPLKKVFINYFYDVLCTEN
jgi:hypothetical protein